MKRIISLRRANYDEMKKKMKELVEENEKLLSRVGSYSNNSHLSKPRDLSDFNSVNKIPDVVQIDDDDE